MPLAGIVLLTPRGFLLMLAVILPLAALVVAGRRVRRVRQALGLASPAGAGWGAGIALGGVCGLLALAAAQPVLRAEQARRVRTDAEAFVVFDVSRSMLAASPANGRSRFARAQAAGVRLRAALGDVPTGVATLTDRVLPDLFPSADPQAFEATVRRALAIESPPPAEQEIEATTLGALGALATMNFFAPSARHRLVILLTDGESRPFRSDRVGRAFAAARVSTIVVRFWKRGERVFGPTGAPEPGYRSDPASAEAVAALAAATEGMTFGESHLGDAAASARRALETGPTVERGVERRTTALAPFCVMVALIPLGFLLRRGVRPFHAPPVVPSETSA